MAENQALKKLLNARKELVPNKHPTDNMKIDSPEEKFLNNFEFNKDENDEINKKESTSVP